MLKGSGPDLALLLTCCQEKGSVPRERLEEPDGHRLLGWFLGTGRHKDTALGLTARPRRAEESSSDRDELGKGACGSEVTVLLGGAQLWEEPGEQPVPPATSSAGLVWERQIESLLMSLAV